MDTRGGWRRLGIVGLGLVIVVSGCSGSGDSSGPDIPIEHRVIDSAPDRLADTGPPPGSYRQEWRTTVDTGDEIPGYALIAGHLVVVTGSGFRAYDALTGDPSWHYREPGRAMQGWAETDGVIVVGTSDDRFENRHVVGLDAGTGERLWEKHENWSITVAGDSRAVPAPLMRGDASAGVVVVQREPVELLGIDARTGEERWRVDDFDVTDECAADAGTTDEETGGDLVLVKLDCGLENSVFVALDATSGAPRWRRHSTGYDVRATMRDGVTLWKSADQPPVLIAPGGQVLFTAPDEASSRCDSECGLVVSGGRALLTFGEGVLHSVDLDTREAVAVPGSPGRVFVQATTAVAGGLLYEVAPVESPPHENGVGLLPAMLRVTDPTSLRTDYAALPFPAPTASPAIVAGWFGVAGDRIFTVARSGDPNAPSGPPVLTAYTLRDTTTPTELGGVAPQSWPDPCALLAGVPTEIEHDRGRPVTIGGVTVPATSCRIRRPGIGKAILTVDWVAATAQEADLLFEDGEPPTVGADEEHGMGSDYARVRVGRTVVSLRTGGGDMAGFAGAVVRNLRGLG